jgi:hypothetical protein
MLLGFQNQIFLTVKVNYVKLSLIKHYAMNAYEQMEE